MKVLLFLFLLHLSFSLSTKIVSIEADADSLAPHKTSAFRFSEPKPLIVRRGFPFVFKVNTDQHLQDGEEFAVSVSPSSLVLELIVQHDADTQYLLQLTTRHSAAVGQYQLTINVNSGSTPISSVPLNGSLIVLFNPYSSVDLVYMAEQDNLKEYIENEYGMIWRGSTEWHSGTKWYYGQFSENSLKAALYLLSKFKGDTSDPVLISRYLTWASTYQQSNRGGLLVGNWGDDFSGGVSPSTWTSTTKIMDQFVSSGFKPVKYGQCWVFAAVMNTLMRALGIPSRQIITFESGHETPDDNGRYRQVIEYHYNDKKKMMYTVGSIWNFHSWNEMWLHHRPDASLGWQAVDATPQEFSEGAFRMGPAAVADVKKFNASAPYDTPFVRSEVAATLEIWLDQCSGRNCKPLRMLSNDTQTGELVVTPVIGSDQQNEVTWDYKEKTKARRNVGGVEAQRSTANGVQIQPKFLEMEAGKPLRFAVRVASLKETEAKVELSVGVHLTKYTGVLVDELKSLDTKFALSAANSFEEVREFEIPVEEYEAVIRDHSLLFSFFAQAGEETVVVHKSIVLATPSIHFSVAGAGGHKHVISNNENMPNAVFQKDKVVPVTISFTNPYNAPLKNSVLSLSAGELEVNVEEHMIDVGIIEPKATFTKSIEVTITSAGKHSLIVNFVSDKLQTRGFVDIHSSD